MPAPCEADARGKKVRESISSPILHLPSCNQSHGRIKSAILVTKVRIGSSIDAAVTLTRKPIMQQYDVLYAAR
jgi:hypothetical protein